MLHCLTELQVRPAERYDPSKVCMPDWYHVALFRDAEVTLRPLHSEHAGAWLTQSRDRRIMELTRLPVFETVHEVERWLRERWVATIEPLDHTRVRLRSFALLHDQWGFIGSVTLYTLGSCAFFSYWVGADYQGRGLGKQALRLLHRVAPLCLEVDELFTAVYESNTRSRRVLEGCGWRQLPFGSTTDAGRTLVYRTRSKSHDEPERDERATRQHLTALLEELGSDLVMEDNNHMGLESRLT